MQSKIVFGNAQKDGTEHRGWFIGYFMPDNDPRFTSEVEVKWTVHQAGEGRREWAINAEATTVSILIAGRFRVQFPDSEIVLSNQGDYVFWCPGVAHTWVAESDSTILTVRWPSKSGDSVGMSKG